MRIWNPNVQGWELYEEGFVYAAAPENGLDMLLALSEEHPHKDTLSIRPLWRDLPEKWLWLRVPPSTWIKLKTQDSGGAVAALLLNGAPDVVMVVFVNDQDDLVLARFSREELPGAQRAGMWLDGNNLPRGEFGAVLAELHQRGLKGAATPDAGELGVRPVRCLVTGTSVQIVDARSGAVCAVLVA